MAVGGLFKLAQRAFFAKPSPERQLLKLAKQEPLHRVVELGIESIDTTAELLRTLVKKAGVEAVSYTALDPFDERSADAEPLALVAAYRKLVATGARVRLAPGQAGRLLPAEANALADTDLLLLSRETYAASLGTAWFYVPRMCHPGTRVFGCAPGAAADDPYQWSPIPLEEVAALADGGVTRLAA